MSYELSQEQVEPGIYLFVLFDWPEEIPTDLAQTAAELHSVIENKEWINEAVAASGGIGGEQSSVWVFWLENYAGLDRLLKDQSDDVSQLYHSFFGQMRNVRDFIREKVLFL